MECTKIRQHLSEYIEGVLSREQAQQVEAHLQACPLCAREYRAMERVPALLRQWMPPVRSEQIWAGIERRIRAGSEKRATGGSHPQATRYYSPFAIRYRFAAALAITAVAVLIALFVWYRSAPSYPPLKDPYTNYWQAHHQWAISGGASELYPYVEAQ